MKRFHNTHFARRHAVGCGLFALALTVLAGVGVPAARALPGGIEGESGKQGTICTLCHMGGTAPLVRFEGPTTAAPGAEVPMRFVVVSQSPLQTHSGFNVAASGGTLRIATDQGARTVGTEITHSSPKPNIANQASWGFLWVAPTMTGTYTLFGAGNSVNLNSLPTGDFAAATTHVIEVVAAMPTLTPTPTPTDSSSPKPTSTPREPGPCIGDCNQDGLVTVDELMRGVNVSLGATPLDTCSAFDANADRQVTVNELVQAVNAALIGCPAELRTPSKVCPGGYEPGPTGLTFSDLKRDGFGDETDVTVVFCNPLMPEEPDELVFFVILSNHFGIPRSDLTQGTWAETSEEGLRTRGQFLWDGDDLTYEDHHAKGWLTGPRTTEQGAELIGPRTTGLTLHLTGIGYEEEMTFEWEKDYLP